MRALAKEPPTVLIVSNDATAAALLGGLVETFGYGVAFTSVLDANDSMRRTRPRVCLLDCENDACDEAAVARVMMRGVAVVLVGPRSLLAGMKEIVARYGAEVVFSPAAPEPLGEVLHRAVRRPA
jgi:hypothetical protein